MKTERIQKLYDKLIYIAQRDRTSEWFKQEMFPDLEKLDLKQYGLKGAFYDRSVILRRSIAIDVMLKAMTDAKNSEKTRTAEIHEGDLLLGNLPMGSNGLGKVFPQFLTDDELRAGSISNRNAGSLFGHNSLNYENMLKYGLKKVIEECEQKYQVAKNSMLNSMDLIDKVVEHKLRVQCDFYRSVRIACQAVVDYGARCSDIALKYAGDPAITPERKAELLEMARIAKKVPLEPAENFQEAVQSITFFHIALHASMNFISFGRLDQVLAPYLQEEIKNGKRDFALEVFECFIIKMAWRLNLSSDFLITQDHVDYSTVLGTHPYYIDQKAGVNNFLQNIIIGGKTPEGQDATNECTFLILDAFKDVNLSTPGVYIRIHKDSPPDLMKSIASTLEITKNNPAILNDEVMIPAFYRALMQDDWEAYESKDPTEDMLLKRQEMQTLANDYCVDGCWEPILNGKSDWTFAMFNILSVLETALNNGATLSPDEEVFRGAKIAPLIESPKNFEQLMENLKKQNQFFSDQCIMSLFLYYMLDEYCAPSPLLSALMDGCLENGRDKSWGGANYNLGGLIYGGVPNLVNTLAAIEKWVFPKVGQGKYRLEDVMNAFKFSFTDPKQKSGEEKTELQKIYESMEVDFNTNSPKFGNNDQEADVITNAVLDMCYQSAIHSAEFGKRVFQDIAEPKDVAKTIALRNIAGYYGMPLKRRFDRFQMKITVGMGTFEQYNWQGRGSAASADRKSGAPIAPNFSPVPGTNTKGFVGLCQSFSNFRLDRFAGGVITDICFDETYADADTLENALYLAVENGIPMLTIAVGSKDKYKEIYEKVKLANDLNDKEQGAKLLEPYAGINVRIGGWQTPFITLPLIHMENYILRPVSQ